MIFPKQDQDKTLNNNITNMNTNTITDPEDYHYRFKIVVLGDVKSGKTVFLDSKTLFN